MLEQLVAHRTHLSDYDLAEIDLDSEHQVAQASNRRGRWLHRAAGWDCNDSFAGAGVHSDPAGPGNTSH